MPTNPNFPNDFIQGFFTRNYPNVGKNTINPGDLVYVDQTSFDVKALDTDAHAAFLVGVSNDEYPILPELTQATAEGINVERHIVAPMILKLNDVAVPGQNLYIGATAQTVTSATAGNSNKVGTLYNKPDGSYAPSVTGDGVTRYLVVITPPTTI